MGSGPVIDNYKIALGKKGEQLLKSNIDDTKKKLNIEPANGLNFLNLAKGRLDEGELRKSAIVQKAVVKWKCVLHNHDSQGQINLNSRENFKLMLFRHLFRQKRRRSALGERDDIRSDQ